MSWDNDDETRSVRLWAIRRTEKAILFSDFPEGTVGARKIWIPLSQIIHISHDPHEPGEWGPCTVEMTAWIAEKNDL